LRPNELTPGPRRWFSSSHRGRELMPRTARSRLDLDERRLEAVLDGVSDSGPIARCGLPGEDLPFPPVEGAERLVAREEEPRRRFLVRADAEPPAVDGVDDEAARSRLLDVEDVLEGGEIEPGCGRIVGGDCDLCCIHSFAASRGWLLQRSLTPALEHRRERDQSLAGQLETDLPVMQGQLGDRCRG